MSLRPTTPDEFYRVRVPAHFNATFDAQRALGSAGAALAESMAAVDGTIRIVARGERETTYYLNIERGQMSSGDAPSHEPFLTLSHQLESFEVIAKESRDSILGFLGGIAGLSGEMQLTTRRLENLVALDGTLEFRRVGEDGFTLRGTFGRDAVDDEPRCTLTLDRDTHAELATGKLSAEDAFLGGRIRVDGDMQLAISLAFAALSAD